MMRWQAPSRWLLHESAARCRLPVAAAAISERMRGAGRKQQRVTHAAPTESWWLVLQHVYMVRVSRQRIEFTLAKGIPSV